MPRRVQDSLVVGVRGVLYTNGTLVLIEDHLDDLRLNQDVEVGMLAVLEERVQEGMGGILSLALWRDVTHPPLEAIVCLHVLQVADLGVSHLLRRSKDVVLGTRDPKASRRDVHGACLAMVGRVTIAMVRLKAVKVRAEVL